MKILLLVVEPPLGKILPHGRRTLLYTSCCASQSHFILVLCDLYCHYLPLAMMLCSGTGKTCFLFTFAISKHMPRNGHSGPGFLTLAITSRMPPSSHLKLLETPHLHTSNKSYVTIVTQCQAIVVEGEAIPFTEGRDLHSDVPNMGLGPND